MSVLLLLYVLFSLVIQSLRGRTSADTSAEHSKDEISFAKNIGKVTYGQKVEIVCNLTTREHQRFYKLMEIHYWRHNGSEARLAGKTLEYLTPAWTMVTQNKYTATLSVNWTVDSTIKPEIQCLVWGKNTSQGRELDATVKYTLQFKDSRTTIAEPIESTPPIRKGPRSPKPTQAVSDSVPTSSVFTITHAVTNATPISSILTNTTTTNTTGTGVLYPILAGSTFLILIALVAGLIYYCMKNRKHKDIENSSVDYRKTARVKGDPRIVINGEENQTIEEGPNNMQMSHPAGTEGLVYAELDLDKKEKNEKKKAKNLKPVVHGTENLVEYASLDWKKSE